jgi:branched-chain amino acid transport system substrate-binding protein
MKLKQGNPAVLPKTLCRSALIASALCMASVAQAQTTYNIAGTADFTGPYAENMVEWADCRRVVLDWWNAEVGKGQGVALRVKEYDTRYNAAQVASLWPGIKSELNPVAIMGLGGPDVSALQERLPKDKVPLILISAGYGFAWKGDNWVFNLRPTYTHELAGFYTWMQKKSQSGCNLIGGLARLRRYSQRCGAFCEGKSEGNGSC